MPKKRVLTSDLPLTTRRSERNLRLHDEAAPVTGSVLKQPAELDVGGRRTRRKVDDDDQHADNTSSKLPHTSPRNAKKGALKFESAKGTVEKVAEHTGAGPSAPELATPGTTSERAQPTKPTRTLSWAEFAKAPCASSPVYNNPYPCDDAVMVQPPGPKRHSSIHQKTPSKQPGKTISRFDLTSAAVLAGSESASKRQKLNDNLDFPHSRRNGEQRHGGLESFKMNSEFSKVQDMLHPPRGKYQTQKSSRDSSRQATIEVEDDDPIESSQEKKPQVGYTGTAGLRPARTKDEIAATSRPKQRRTEVTSAYFQDTESHMNSASQRPMTGGGNTVSKPKLSRRMQNGVSGKRSSTEIDEISEDELSAKRPKRVNHIPQPDSASLSRAGDITPMVSRSSNIFTKESVMESERLQAKFPVLLAKSERDSYMASKGVDPACFVWNSKSKALQLVCEGRSDLHPTLVIGLGKILKITCSKTPQLDGEFFLRQLSPMPVSLVVKLSELRQGEEFLIYLKKLSPDSPVLPYPSEQMKRVFEKQNKDLDAYHYKFNQSSGFSLSSSLQKPEDIQLLESRKASRSQIQRPLQSTETTAGLRRTLPNSMTVEGRTRSAKNAYEERSRISTSPDRERASTRSTRSQQIVPLRSPSPPLECWTDTHRSWQEIHWKGDEPLVYPPEGEKRATVDRRDIERLNEGEFLNDNLLQFYLRYLEEKTKAESPAVAKRVLFMNPFFYQRLTRGRGRSSIDYDGVKRWTSKVDVFEYDYILVPVNEHAHWYLAVICNTPAFLKPPQAEETKAEDNDTSEAEISLLEVKAESAAAGKTAGTDFTADVEEKVHNLSIEDSTILIAEDGTATKGRSISPKQRKKKRLLPPRRKVNPHEPRIITMDSLGYTHSPTCTNLKEFLIAEAKARKKVDVVLRDPKVGLTAKNIPEQTNHCDCGLFLLGYVEYFLQNPDATMHDIMEGKPEVMEHFSKLDASKMRAEIRELLFDLKQKQTEQQQSEKQARIAKRRAQTASEVGDSLPPTTEPTPAPSPTRSDTVATEQHHPPASNQSRRNSTEEADESSLIELEGKPEAANADGVKPASKQNADPDDTDIVEMIDELSGYIPPEREVPKSLGVQGIAERHKMSSPLKPNVVAKHKPELSTTKSVEYLSTQPRSSPRAHGLEFAGRNALNNARRNPESLSSSSESSEEESPQITKESIVKKKIPDTSMPPVPAAPAFEGSGHEVGPTPNNSPINLGVFDLENEDDESNGRPNHSHPLYKAEQRYATRNLSAKPLQETPKNTSKSTDNEAVEIPVKLFTPKGSKLPRPIQRSYETNSHGATHIRFSEDDEEMIMNGNSQVNADDDGDADSLFRGMSPDIVAASAKKPSAPTGKASASAKKPSVEIPPRSSEIGFDNHGEPRSGSGARSPEKPKATPKRVTTPTPASSPGRAASRTSPRSGRGKQSLLRETPILPPPRRNAAVTSSPSVRSTKPGKTYGGSSRPSSRERKEMKSRAAEAPIVID